jgi:hypothetical protein
MAERLAAVFPDLTLETFPDRHNFDPPHRGEPERLADSLLAHGDRAGEAAAPGRRRPDRDAAGSG